MKSFFIDLTYVCFGKSSIIAHWLGFVRWRN